MPEAERRTGALPTQFDKARRVVGRLWRLYPPWYRSTVRVGGQIVLVYLGIGIVCFVIVWLLFHL